MEGRAAQDANRAFSHFNIAPNTCDPHTCDPHIAFIAGIRYAAQEDLPEHDLVKALNSAVNDTIHVFYQDPDKRSILDHALKHDFEILALQVAQHIADDPYARAVEKQKLLLSGLHHTKNDDITRSIRELADKATDFAPVSVAATTSLAPHHH